MSERHYPIETPAVHGENPRPALALFDRVIRMRIALATALLLPLGFFVFLVLRFHEAWLLAGLGVIVYLYILAQFFVWQNPRRKAMASGQGPSRDPKPSEERG